MITPTFEFAFTVTALLEPVKDICQRHGALLRVVPICGGTVEGAGIRGRVMAGGNDWQTVFPDGTGMIDAQYVVETDDGVVIKVRNRGVMALPPESLAGAPLDPTRIKLRTACRFMAPEGRYDWLNKSIFVSTIEVPGMDRVLVHLFKVV